MFDKFKDILPGTITSLIISLVTTLVVFSSTFSTLRAEVSTQGELLKTKASETELKSILQGQEKRLDRIETKIDRIGERIK